MMEKTLLWLGKKQHLALVLTVVITCLYFLQQYSPSPGVLSEVSLPLSSPQSQTLGLQDDGIAFPAATTSAVVTKVVDGDTIKLNTGQTVRYIGIDTPETKDPRKAVECFGGEASSRNAELVLNQTVVLEKDVSEVDRYGRLLRYVYVNGQHVNELLVSEGLAHAAAFPPDVKYAAVFQAAEQHARANRVGLWSQTCQ